MDWIVQELRERLTGEALLANALLTITVAASALVVFLRAAPARDLRAFLRFITPWQVISHPSARADFLFWITRKVFMALVVFPTSAAFVAASAYGVNRAISFAFGLDGPLVPGPAGPAAVIAFTASMLLAYDLSYYIYHRAQHRIPFLWELHKVHHSAEVMVGVTKDRIHPLDDFMNRMWDGVIPGVMFGIWTAIALNPVEATVFGLNVYVLRNILMMDFVRHMHLPVSFGPLNGVILCPQWHQLHHSIDPQHYNRNYGLLFSFWDRMFGTAAIPAPEQSFSFGLENGEAKPYQSLYGLYVRPVVGMWRALCDGWRGAQRAPRAQRGLIHGEPNSAPALGDRGDA